MTDTIPHAVRQRILHAVPDNPSVPRRAATAAPLLNSGAALRLDQAELFLLSLDNEMLTADAPRAAYLLGVAELHLAALIEILRAVTS